MQLATVLVAGFPLDHHLLWLCFRGGHLPDCVD